MKRLAVAASLALTMLSCTRAGSPGAPSPPTGIPGLSGVVFDKSSGATAPLEGVLVTANFFFNPTRYSATTDAAGFYRISSLPAGASVASVEVSVGGYAAYKNNVQIYGDTRLDIQLVPRVLYTLSGVVTEPTESGRRPVEGVRIETFACDMPNCAVYLELVGVTDRSGIYSIPGLWAGHETAVWVVKPGYRVDDVAPLNPCDYCAYLFTATTDRTLDIALARQ